MDIKKTKKNIIQAGHKAVEELIKVAREEIVDSDEDISADRLKNAAATKKRICLRVKSKKKKKPRLKVLQKVDQNEIRTNVI